MQNVVEAMKGVEVGAGGNAFEQYAEGDGRPARMGHAPIGRAAAIASARGRPEGTNPGRRQLPMPRRRVVIGGRELTLDARPTNSTSATFRYRPPARRCRRATPT